MRVLLDTNIIIHREAGRVVKDDIGVLFNWLDKLEIKKCVHPLTINEIDKNPNAETVRTMKIKIANYNVLKTTAPLHPAVKAIAEELDKKQNDIVDTALINEVYCDRVDLMITEDKKIHEKAKALGIESRVYFVNTFLEYATSTNPELVDYKVLSVKKAHFGDVDLRDTFFDSFRDDYVGFDKWFNKKSDEIAYVCYEQGSIVAFLFLKVEKENEPYVDILPAFAPKKRLKIGTFKVISNGLRIGERFLKIVFDNAMLFKVDEIYVTIFDNQSEQKRLIVLLEEFGFRLHGNKTTVSGIEKVYCRLRMPAVIEGQPRLSFPKLDKYKRAFIIPIKPQYHTELFPDSKLNTESAFDFIENEPYRNSISKVYLSHSPNRDLKSGDIIVFYRTGGMYAGVATTIGIVENVIDNIESEHQLLEICRKRTVLNPDEIKDYWNKSSKKRPFVINFLYTFSLKKRITLKEMLDRKILPNMDAVMTINEIGMDSLKGLITIAGV